MVTNFTPFMRDLEARFREASSLTDRSQYKIYYSQIRPAKILTLGINPGGEPSNINPDGKTQKDGIIAAASSGYYENNEHDIIDCNWRENKGLLKLLLPLCGGDLARLRNEVVKTNLAFRRSASVKHIDIAAAINESAPFLSEIIGIVQPKLVLLTGAKLSLFADYFADKMAVIVQPEVDQSVNQTVFAAASIESRKTNTEFIAVQVAHASQFSWTYERHNIAERIAALIGTPAYSNSSQPFSVVPHVSHQLPQSKLTKGPGMSRKSKEDYEGMYRILRTPGSMRSHNEISWHLIEKTIVSNGGQADFYMLVEAVKDHQTGTATAPHPYQFVTYCAKQGWLIRVEQ